MRLTVDFGENGSPTAVTVDGGLDVRAANEFTQLVMGLHGVMGPDVCYDLGGVDAQDDAGRSALEMIAHEFREHGLRVTMPPTFRPRERLS